MTQQILVWNRVWSELKDGSFSPASSFKAVVDSIDLYVNSVQRTISELSGASAPPWVALNPKSPASVRVKWFVTPDNLPRVNVARLGRSDSVNLDVDVELADPSGGYELFLFCPAAAETGLGSGDYVGLLVSDAYPGPLAIVTLSIS